SSRRPKGPILQYWREDAFRHDRGVAATLRPFLSLHRIWQGSTAVAINAGKSHRWERNPSMHNDRDPAAKLPTPIREPKPGTFHRPAHGFGIERAPRPRS